MRGQNVGKKRIAHALDPLDMAANGAIAYLTREPTSNEQALAGLLLRTAGCFDRLPLALFSLDPDRITCHRCRLYLKKHPQYCNYLRALTDVVKSPEPPPSAA